MTSTAQQGSAPQVAVATKCGSAPGKFWNGRGEVDIFRLAFNDWFFRFSLLAGDRANSKKAFWPAHRKNRLSLIENVWTPRRLRSMEGLGCTFPVAFSKLLLECQKPMEIYYCSRSRSSLQLALQQLDLASSWVAGTSAPWGGAGGHAGCLCWGSCLNCSLAICRLQS